MARNSQLCTKKMASYDIDNCHKKSLYYDLFCFCSISLNFQAVAETIKETFILILRWGGFGGTDISHLFLPLLGT